MESRLPVLDDVEQFLKMYYVPIASVLATGLSLMLLKRYFAGGRCYSKAKLTGKVVIVTGANTGIGKETAKDLAQRGAKVILACRDVAKGVKAAVEIGGENIEVKKLDLSSLESVRSFAKSVIDKEQRLDILINNAGVFMCPQQETADGFELQFGTNHLGHFLLTNLLLDLMKKSAPSRIVNVSSGAHMLGKMHFDDLNMKDCYTPGNAYNQSKLANVLFTKELARRLKGTGVTCYSLHPGVVRTDIARHLFVGLRAVVYCVSFIFFKNSKDGAQTTIHCAVEESLENETGFYYSDCKRVKASRKAQDEEAAKKLWDMSAQMVNLDVKED
ncbi:retinol dehydrogenase 12-like [Anneissia japonica]|uniref:retinol dehydrogenase 12-like n=1 Tax=Anneissia japonica TaxID=1529436 RepID=UPI0014254E97|nr:retinol dehydrogenase 12-like [Anneissia japonica]